MPLVAGYTWDGSRGSSRRKEHDLAAGRSKLCATQSRVYAGAVEGLHRPLTVVTVRPTGLPEAPVVASTTEAVVKAPPPRSRRVRWLAIITVTGLAAAYLAAITSTHAALSASPVGWSGVLPVNSGSLATPTAAEYADVFPTDQGYGEVLWANRPGGEVTFGPAGWPPDGQDWPMMTSARGARLSAQPGPARPAELVNTVPARH